MKPSIPFKIHVLLFIVIFLEKSINRWFYWFFVASYVMKDNNKLTERDVDNDIPH